MLQNNPFTSYGETCIVCVQNIVLVLLLWAFMKPAPSTLHKLAVSGSLVAFTFLSFTEIQPEFQYLLPLCGVPLLVYSRGAQVWSNFLNGSTGQLSIITSFLQLGGSAARIFTTIQEVGYDIPLLTGYGTSFMLSATLLLQVRSFQAFFVWNIYTMHEIYTSKFCMYFHLQWYHATIVAVTTVATVPDNFSCIVMSRKYFGFCLL